MIQLNKTFPFILSLAPVAIFSQENSRPNIILINVDDLGWSDLSFNGSKYYETPNVDALRERGTFYSDAYACAANSAPSRACMISGQYSPRHGVYTVAPSDRGKSEDRKLIPCETAEVLAPDILTLPQILKENGYQTCMVGKWHLGDDPTTQGFDINYGGYKKGHPNSYFSPYNNPMLKDGPKGEYLADRLGDEASGFLKNRDKNKPFFLYYATYEVHTPLQAPKDLIEKYEKKVKNDAHFNPIYAAMVEAMDRNVGKVLDMLKELGLEDNTLIIFTSDNGGVYSVSKQWPLRAGKGSFYEGGIRIPLIISWPSKIASNQTNTTPVSQIDIFPTLLSVAKIDKPADTILDGIDQSNLFFNGVKTDRSLFWHFPAYLEGGNEETKDQIFRSRPVSVIRKGDWKLIHNLENNELELYNLTDDISEKNNLSTLKKKKARELKKELDKWKLQVNACPLTEQNPEYRER